MTEATTNTLEVPGAVLHYDVRTGGSGAPTLLLIGSPMAAPGFATLAGYLTDRTVVTYDPRGSERSRLTNGAEQCTPEEHADDLSRLITTVANGPVDIFASSGGAVNGLALMERHPEQVGTLVAHEPPAVRLLPDGDAALAASQAVHQTYQRAGFGPAMAKFIALVSLQGPVPSDFADQPAPDPATFGLPTEDDGSRDDPLAGLNILTCTHHDPDLGTLRANSDQIVLAVGATSAGTLAHRAGVAMADAVGIEPVVFPGGHDGFAGGEYGSVGEPEAFAAKLREVLDQRR